MMMAYDSSQTPASRLEAATIDALRAALREYLASSSTTALRASLVRMAPEAREKLILPEPMLIALKAIWSALPEVRDMSDAGEQIRLQQRVVTMCITEYYSA